MSHQKLLKQTILKLYDERLKNFIKKFKKTLKLVKCYFISIQLNRLSS